MDATEIDALSDRRLVELVQAEFFGRYERETRAVALVHAEYVRLKGAWVILSWSLLKKARHRAQVSEARGRLRGWLYQREVARGAG